MFRNRQLAIALNAILVALSFVDHVGAQHTASAEVPTGILGEGKPWAMPWYEVKGAEPGPTVLITGGVHGNEPAGAMAAQQIRFWPIKRGRLIVIPRVNDLGLRANIRWYPPARNDREVRDLNRNFPNGPDNAPRGPLAETVWEFVKSQKPDLAIDLHEGFDFHTSNSKSVGSSVICSPGDETTRLAKKMQKAVNATINIQKRNFDLLNRKGAVNGSLIRACADRLGLTAFILETTFKDQMLSLRTRQHRRMVSVLLNEFGVIDRDCTAIVASGEHDRLLRIGMFDGPGTTTAGHRNLGLTFEDTDAYAFSHFGPKDVSESFLNQFDLVIFPGGSGSKQGKALGSKARESVRSYVRDGGGIMGICAGAYLCSAHYDWSLHVINTRVYNKMETIPGVGRKSMWYRGGPSTVKFEPTPAGTRLLGLSETTGVRYQNGPIVSPGKDKGLGDYQVLAWFRSEVSKYAPQKGTMVDTPAIVTAPFGKGRVVSISPHPEATPNLRSVVRNAANRAAGR